jgi:plasmid maintenance system killer protein
MERRVDIAFKNEGLRALCNESRKASKKLGDLCAKKLRTRSDDLRDCRRLEDMRNLPGRCHELVGDLAGFLAVDLHGGMRLIFEPAHDPRPEKGDGGLDWREVTAIRIVDIKDYHG